MRNADRRSEISVPNLKSKGKVKEFTASVPVSGETHRRRDEKSAELVEVPHYRQDVITASNEKHLSITIGVPKLVSYYFITTQMAIHN